MDRMLWSEIRLVIRERRFPYKEYRAALWDTLIGYASDPLKLLCRMRLGHRGMWRRYCLQYIFTCFIGCILLLQVVRMFMPTNMARGRGRPMSVINSGNIQLYSYRQYNTECLQKKDYIPASFDPGANPEEGSEGQQPEITIPRCEVVHLGTRCYGVEEMYNVTLLVKSVLMFSRSAVKFHIVTDEPGRAIIQHFMDSWELQHVAVQYYTEPQTRVVEYFVKHPPSDVDTLLVLKPSVVFISDVATFWAAARQNSSMHYVVRALESHYLSFKDAIGLQKYKLPSAKTAEGVVLDLRELRHKNLCMLLGATALEEVRPDYNFIYHIACKDKEPPSDANVYTIPRLVLSGIMDPSLLSDTLLPDNYKHIINTLGDTLRTRTVDESCSWIYTRPVVQFDEQGSLDDYCYHYRYQACITRRTHLYFNHYTLTTHKQRNNAKSQASGTKPEHAGNQHRRPESALSRSDVTLVTQLQYNRLNGLKNLIKSWSGPMQVTMYLTDEEVKSFSLDVKGSMELRRGNVNIHVVYKRQVFYPINVLRNIAMREVRTNYLFVLDVDFVTMPGLYEHLVDVVTYTVENPDNKRAIIVPTFETFEVNYEVPATKKDFIRDIHLGKVEPYHQGSFWSFKSGHKPHNYPRWFQASSPYKITWEPKFEPYIVMPTAESPLYEEILIERMQDKMPYTLEVVLKGFSFFVLSDAYVVHFPHEKSLSHVWHRDLMFRRCASYFYETIQQGLELKYAKPDRTSDSEKLK